MNYEKIINQLGQEISQYAVNQAFLLAEIDTLKNNLNEIDKKYTDACAELKYLNESKGEIDNE